MYARDQRQIEMWAGRNPDNTLDVGTFVLLTIQQQFSGVGRQLERVRAGDLTPLWGHKRAGYEYLREKRFYLWHRSVEAREGRIWVNDLLRDYLACPGLGLVKAGFVVQLLTGEVGCLDMHNVERFSLSDRDFKIPKRKDVDEQLRVVDEYIAHYLWMCERCGGSERLWDGWCNYVGELYTTWESGDAVSRAHVDYLIGGTT